ncbi:MAG TPA: carbon-nitrogen hydrolase family protein [Thermotogota bacterium]|nr:carbon-nitrogen hydrolase family protein [Thermotogota bacterium]HRW93179.1 carbon-nitrogen hydrolase family protein [Thermotogota bacterium]
MNQPLVRVACAQMLSRPLDVEANLQKASCLLGTLEQPVDLVVLPELFACGYTWDPALLDVCAQHRDAIVSWMEKQSTALQAVVMGGMAQNRSGKWYNSMAIASEGRLRGFADKCHLFRGEKALFTPGRVYTLFQAREWSVGVFLCYELGFPELFRLLAREGAMGFAGGFAFGKSRGPLYDVLTRARSMENGAFFASACQPGELPSTEHSPAFSFHGHSRILTHRGEILADALEKEGMIVAEVRLAGIGEYRMQEQGEYPGYFSNFREDIHSVEYLKG